SPLKMKDLYEFLGALLDQQGYSAHNPAWINNVFASLIMRQYPLPGHRDYYREMHIFLRQPQTPTTKIEITFMVKGGELAETPGPLSGVWAFAHVGDRFQGTIELHQSGSNVTGIWHTSVGKSEPDSSVAGRLSGRTVTLIRYVGGNQTFLLTL